MKALIIDTTREGYAIGQIRRTLTVGELISILDQYDEDTLVYTGHDNRYTYGGIREWDINEWEGSEDDE